MEENSIKWLFFDVGCTLVDEMPVWMHRAEEQLSISRKAGLTPITAEEIITGLIERTADFQPSYRDLVLSLGFDHAAPYRPKFECLYADIKDTLESLEKKYRLGIIANQKPGLDGRLKKYGIRRYFDIIISSAEVGCEKPDERIFTLALEKAGCRSDEAMMIGDRLDNDIEPAKRLGMHTARVLTGTAIGQKPHCPAEEPDITVKNLTELKEIM